MKGIEMDETNEEVALILTFTPEQVQRWKAECKEDWGNEDWDSYVMGCIRQLTDEQWGIKLSPDDVNMYVKGYVQNLQAENKHLSDALHDIAHPVVDGRVVPYSARQAMELARRALGEGEVE